MKFFKFKYLLIGTSISLISTPLLATISCSNNSIESKLNSLLNDSSIVNLNINIEAIKEQTNKTKIDIKDLFVTNTSVIEIENSKKLNEWNNEHDVNSGFNIRPKIVGVILPEVNNDNLNIKSLQIVIDVSSGPLSDKTITKTIDLTQYSNDIETRIILGENNVFSIETPDGPRENELWRAIYNNSINYIRSLNLPIDNPNTLKEKLNFEFSNSSQNGYVSYQNNLYSIYNSEKQISSGYSLFVYTSNSSAELVDVKNQKIAIEIIINNSDIENSMGGN